jgi:hypothetical protein
MHSLYFSVPDFQFIENHADGHRHLIQNNYHRIINILDLRSLLSNGGCHCTHSSETLQGSIVQHSSPETEQRKRTLMHMHKLFIAPTALSLQLFVIWSYSHLFLEILFYPEEKVNIAK